MANNQFFTKSRKDRIKAAALLIPAGIILMLIIILPEIVAVGMAFTNYTFGVKELKFVGLENFAYILKDPNFFNSVQKNLIFVAVGVSLQVILGTLVSLHMAKQFKFQRVWIALIMMPSTMSLPITISIWKYILQLDFGILNYFIEQLGFARINFLNERFAMVTIILISIWGSIPFIFMFVYPARTTLPISLYESATIDGASGWQCLRYITLPLLRPAILVAAIFRTIFSLRTFGLPWLLTQGGPNRAIELLGIYLYQEAFAYNRLASGAAVSILILIITAIVASYQVYQMYQRTFAETISY